MTDQSDNTPDKDRLDEEWQQKLRSKPLVGRARWLMRRLAYVLLWIVALLFILAFADGIWLVVGLVILAFGAIILPEVLMDLRYSKYREEWRIANGAELDSTD